MNGNISLTADTNCGVSELVDGDGVFKYYSYGEWKKSSSGKSVAIINPTTRQPHFKVQACTQQEVDKLMDEAKTAQKSWAKTPLWKRAELLHKAAALLKEHKAVRSGDLVSYCAEEGVRILGEGKFGGTAAVYVKWCEHCYSPFNYPVNLAVRRLLLHLLLEILLYSSLHPGCCSCTSHGALLSFSWFPKGLISCVTGKGSEIGTSLQCTPSQLNQELSCGLSTNSTHTQLHWWGHWNAISKKAGMIPLQMELGGKDACIILEDADLDLAASNIVKGGFSYRCTAVKVVLVMESVANALVEKKGLHFAKSTGERQPYMAIVIRRIRPDMRIAWEEPFGPVLPVIRITSVEEGIHHCNASNFGLQYNNLIILNCIPNAYTSTSSSSRLYGLKDSGIGSQGITNSINMMTKIKTTVINLPPSYTMG
ncbi:NADP-dependent glyceraldehyde-3-phosphate dehydrogenase [Hibiscus syriacus]|uniref:NADP-dependent glyceraldehyde-3-phosphate dehydrogenase n=1 Tax=Hibiscus syriacus TaxID=106335 RepID=A0A6A3CZF0_HIBSY|nr:NADP-dependent glyceraldehyde-3-phosphate dehydrogenase [Hibiscus syriacus]